ncbi:hypothetical protein L1987_39690 [Smallanthus sonchifolius]|uniref:Uncharacterized protein n=1 Tax=Smallanthus sonchifolius TaxID=185202 RepID=A0ACB9HND8_9ASTR|nr:hypothetical protein L1987_39690 [Smallanthus sonchifolius]
MAAGSMRMNLIKTLLLKLKQHDVGLGLKGLAKSSIGTEQIPPLLEENGKIEVWRINCSAKTPVPKEDIGKFYGGDCYIVLYTYMCYWIGKDSIKVDQNMTARLATTMFNSLKESAVGWCIYYICVLLQQCSTHEKEELFSCPRLICDFSIHACDSCLHTYRTCFPQSERAAALATILAARERFKDNCNSNSEVGIEQTTAH